MPRPRKSRRVCALPINQVFGPLNKENIQSDNIIMSIEEYEAIRLIDYEGFMQEECVERMAVSRTTVQRIYNNARIKMAKAVVEGKTLSIEGGNYVLCEDRDASCGQGRCHMYGRNGNGNGQGRGNGQGQGQGQGNGRGFRNNK